MGEEEKFTRVFVSGLPAKCDAAAVRKHFGSVGDVTDVKLPVKQGRRRGIGFVGFRTAEAACRAVKELDRSYVRTSRLTVRAATTGKDASPTNKKKKETTNRVADVSERTKRDEFMDFMMPNRPIKKMKKDAAAFDDTLDDLAYLRTKQTVVEKEEEEEDETRLLVRNVAYGASEEDLEARFSAFGTVSEVHAPVDKRGEPLGFAFVRFVLPESAKAARAALDGASLQGRLMRVLPAEEKVENEETTPRRKPRTFSERREADRKRKASTEPSKLGAHVRDDAVVELVSERAGEAFDARDSGAAVTLALAEATVQAQVSDFFRRAGYDLDEGKKARDAILVKNLPARTQKADLDPLFLGDKTVVAPSGTTAIVEYKQPALARAAFKRLAYRRFKRVPLYLDWAPVKTTTTETPVDENIVDDRSDDDDEAPKPSATLFVKNLNFKTTREALQRHFDGARAVSLRRGFGFVEFSTPEDARRALDDKQGSSLDAHRLDLALATPKPSKVKKANTTKLVVRNLAFATTVADLRALFANYGEIKTLRLPKRFDGRHRGFAFVDFAAKRDAAAAIAALTSAHLYGRHLVIEYAKDNDDDQEPRTPEHD